MIFCPLQSLPRAHYSWTCGSLTVWAGLWVQSRNSVGIHIWISENPVLSLEKFNSKLSSSLKNAQCSFQISKASVTLKRFRSLSSVVSSKLWITRESHKLTARYYGSFQEFKLMRKHDTVSAWYFLYPYFCACTTYSSNSETCSRIYP